MLARLGEIAQERGVGRVLVPFVPTSQNTPACEFLESNEAASRQIHGDRWIFSFATETLVGLIYTPPAEKSEVPDRVQSDKSADLAAAENASASPIRAQTNSIPLLRIATELSTAEQVLQAVAAQRRQRPDSQQLVASPRTRIEEQLLETWAEVLKLDQVGIHDDFLALGGTSLLAVQVISRLRTILQVEVPLQSFFEAPTIARLAGVITQMKASGATVHMPVPRAHSRESYRVPMSSKLPAQSNTSSHNQ
jgi:acyl carrier protein